MLQSCINLFLGATYEKVHKNKNRPECVYVVGGVLPAILAISLMFASCDNPSDSNSGNNDGNNTGLDNSNNSNSNNNNSNSDGNNSNNSNSNGNNSNNSNSNGNGNNSNDNSNTSSGNNSNGNSNIENPSPNLPGNVGKNPIKETVKLDLEGGEFYLELNADSTALYVHERNKGEEISGKYKYTYDENKKEIYMKMEKYFYDFLFTHEEGKLLTYNEICTKLNEDVTVEKTRQFLKEYYKEKCEGKEFKEKYPNCNSYDDWEKTMIFESGEFTSFEDYVKHAKQNYEDIHKAVFSAQTTYAYEIEDGKITLTEKFTGVKNMFMESMCGYENSESSYGGIYNDLAFIMENDVYYTGIPNTEEETISFRSEEGLKLNVTYTENLAKETVTMSFNGKDYICEFYGKVFTQAE